MVTDSGRLNDCKNLAYQVRTALRCPAQARTDESCWTVEAPSRGLDGRHLGRLRPPA